MTQQQWASIHNTRSQKLSQLDGSQPSLFWTCGGNETAGGGVLLYRFKSPAYKDVFREIQLFHRFISDKAATQENSGTWKHTINQGWYLRDYNLRVGAHGHAQENKKSFSPSLSSPKLGSNYWLICSLRAQPHLHMNTCSVESIRVCLMRSTLLSQYWWCHWNFGWIDFRRYVVSRCIKIKMCMIILLSFYLEGPQILHQQETLSGINKVLKQPNWKKNCTKTKFGRSQITVNILDSIEYTQPIQSCLMDFGLSLPPPDWSPC